jgi:hypothetical protein
MLSPESEGCGAGALVTAAAGPEGSAGCGVGLEVLQPAKSVRAKKMAAAKEILRSSDNIIPLLSHPIITNKFQNQRKLELLKNRSPEILG